MSTHVTVKGVVRTNPWPSITEVFDHLAQSGWVAHGDGSLVRVTHYDSAGEESHIFWDTVCSKGVARCPGASLHRTFSSLRELRDHLIHGNWVPVANINIEFGVNL